VTSHAVTSPVRRLLPKLLLSLLLGGLLAWLYARGGVPLVPRAGAFASMTAWAIPAYLILLGATHFLRAARWRHLIHPVKPLPLREVLALNWIGFFAIFALPLRLGEVARPALTKVREGVPLSAGFGTIAVERVIDGLITSLAVAWGLFALPRLEVADPQADKLPYYGYLVLSVFAAAFTALAVFLWKREWATRATRFVFSHLSPRLGEALAEKVDSVADGIRSISDLRLGTAFLVESIAYWLLNAVGMWVLAVGCGVPASLGQAVAIMGILAIGILLPAGPGLFGSFQLALLLALRLYFPEEIVEGPGIAYIFLLYGLQATLITVAGVVPLYALHIPLRALLGGGDAGAREVDDRPSP